MSHRGVMMMAHMMLHRVMLHMAMVVVMPGWCRRIGEHQNWHRQHGERRSGSEQAIPIQAGGYCH